MWTVPASFMPSVTNIALLLTDLECGIEDNDGRGCYHKCGDNWVMVMGHWGRSPGPQSPVTSVSVLAR